MNRIRKFLALPLRRKLLVLKCWWMLNLTARALRLLPSKDGALVGASEDEYHQLPDLDPQKLAFQP